MPPPHPPLPPLPSSTQRTKWETFLTMASLTSSQLFRLGIPYSGIMCQIETVLQSCDSSVSMNNQQKQIKRPSRNPNTSTRCLHRAPLLCWVWCIISLNILTTSFLDVTARLHLRSQAVAQLWGLPPSIASFLTLSGEAVRRVSLDELSKT